MFVDWLLVVVYWFEFCIGWFYSDVILMLGLSLVFSMELVCAYVWIVCDWIWMLACFLEVGVFRLLFCFWMVGYCVVIRFYNGWVYLYCLLVMFVWGFGFCFGGCFYVLFKWVSDVLRFTWFIFVWLYGFRLFLFWCLFGYWLFRLFFICCDFVSFGLDTCWWCLNVTVFDVCVVLWL